MKRSSATARTSAAGPCSCQPAHGICKTDSNCAARRSAAICPSCRLPPVHGDAERADLRPDEVRPAARPADTRLRGRHDRRSDRSLPAERRRHLRLGDLAVPVRAATASASRTSRAAARPTRIARPGRSARSRARAGAAAPARRGGRRAHGRHDWHVHRSGDRDQRAAVDVRVSGGRSVVRLRRARKLQGPDVRRAVRAVEADVRPEQAGRLPDVRAGLPERRHADSDRRRSEHVLPDVHLPDRAIRSTPASTTGGTGTVCPAIRCACAKRSARTRPAAARSTSAGRSTPTGPACRRRTPLPNPLPASRGEGT